ncbi:hypothetical protein CC78DRAFT_570553 [Lojkania enalia]|uniref:Uncharacterized protein n=1 Tax=Lojkania enalia TaxID=147567 RepID=A0A9P4K2H7_9PLEO|nr:hypothetical protein CC78DRAFT_570553 [Didymosphaeria enalia]
MRNWDIQDENLPVEPVEKRSQRRRLSRLFSTRKKTVARVEAPEEVRKMPDVYFAFGPSHSYYLYAGRTARLLNIPEQFNRYVLISPDDPIKALQRPQCIALGPTDQEYFAMYTSSEGNDRFTFDFQNSHPDLMDWFKPLPKVIGTHIAVGPCRTFYACIPSVAGGKFYSSTIPATLKNLLDASSSNPTRKNTTHVSLGFGGSWFVLWPNGEVSWDFAGHFPELEDIIKDIPEKSISYLALNPWAAGQYFMVLEDSSVKFCLPSEWATDIEEEIAIWQSRYSTVISSTIAGGKVDSTTNTNDSKVDLVLRKGDKGGRDDPPPYPSRGNKR